jgi:hypothetical protein
VKETSSGTSSFSFLSSLRSLVQLQREAKTKAKYASGKQTKTHFGAAIGHETFCESKERLLSWFFGCRWCCFFGFSDGKGSGEIWEALANLLLLLWRTPILEHRQSCRALVGVKLHYSGALGAAWRLKGMTKMRPEFFEGSEGLRRRRSGKRERGRERAMKIFGPVEGIWRCSLVLGNSIMRRSGPGGRGTWRAVSTERWLGAF